MDYSVEALKVPRADVADVAEMLRIEKNFRDRRVRAYAVAPGKKGRSDRCVTQPFHAQRPTDFQDAECDLLRRGAVRHEGPFWG